MANILVIDDLPWMLKVVEMMLQQQGHSVTCTEDALSVTGMMDEKEFDLVITDVFMPSIDGRDLIKSIKDKSGKIPVIAMTGGGSNIEEIASIMGELKQTADSVLKKPFTVKELTDEVTRLLS
jgi:DNA-binding NtrC family response regulator